MRLRISFPAAIAKMKKARVSSVPAADSWTRPLSSGARFRASGGRGLRCLCGRTSDQPIALRNGASCRRHISAPQPAAQGERALQVRNDIGLSADRLVTNALNSLDLGQGAQEVRPGYARRKLGAFAGSLTETSIPRRDRLRAPRLRLLPCPLASDAFRPVKAGALRGIQAVNAHICMPKGAASASLKCAATSRGLWGYISSQSRLQFAAQHRRFGLLNLARLIRSKASIWTPIRHMLYPARINQLHRRAGRSYGQCAGQYTNFNLGRSLVRGYPSRASAVDSRPDAVLAEESPSAQVGRNGARR
jgi:hypothetical protein